MANAEVVKALKKPEDFMELKTYVSYMKDKSGLNGWKDKQELLLVRNIFSDCTFKFLAFKCVCFIKQ